MRVHEISENYTYQGNCVDSFDEDGESNIFCFTDVSDFAVHEENAQLISANRFMDTVDISDNILEATMHHKIDYQYYSDIDVYALFDIDEDIHYFFTRD